MGKRLDVCFCTLVNKIYIANKVIIKSQYLNEVTCLNLHANVLYSSVQLKRDAST